MEPVDSGLCVSRERGHESHNQNGLFGRFSLLRTLIKCAVWTFTPFLASRGAVVYIIASTVSRKAEERDRKAWGLVDAAQFLAVHTDVMVVSSINNLIPRLADSFLESTKHADPSVSCVAAAKFGPDFLPTGEFGPG